MPYYGYIVIVKKLRKHSNADKLQIATFFGNDVCVDLDVKIGDIGVYFPTDGQLSLEFCEQNNLIRKKDENGNNIGGYLDPNKRNVTTIRLRGEVSDGLYLPISCLDYCFNCSYGHNNTRFAAEGTTIDTVNGHLICQKYIPRKINKDTKNNSTKKHKKKDKEKKVLMFKEHVDTKQLAYNLGVFQPGDEIEITLKMHGTSQRTGYLPVLKGYSDSVFCKLFNFIKTKVCNLFNIKEFNLIHDGKPEYQYDYVTGTRRTILDNNSEGYYGSNEFRRITAERINHKLLKGETVYYEVVGFTDTGVPIMSSVNNAKIKDKEFTQKYGKETVFSYNCDPNGDETQAYTDEENDIWATASIYVYRMTMTNSDGDVIEYPPEIIRMRCKEIGVQPVPLLWKGMIPNDCENPGEWIKEKAEHFYDGPDPIGKTHIREGVVVRLLRDLNTFTAYKHKNVNFKILEGIIKDTADAPDMEEAQELIN